MCLANSAIDVREYEKGIILKGEIGAIVVDKINACPYKITYKKKQFSVPMKYFPTMHKPVVDLWFGNDIGVIVNRSVICVW